MSSKRMKSQITYEINEDKKSLIKNPGMGWVFYIDAFSEEPFPKADDFNKEIDKVAEYANILYMRVPWSELESEKGKYAWEFHEDFKSIVGHAIKKGLRLAFRVYIDGRDSYRQATPDFVRVAGAKGYVVNPGNGKDNTYWTPYVTDAIFRMHFEEFIKAFAKEFDDSRYVDYIDAQGLGWWGEMHNLSYLKEKENKEVFSWITGLYEKNFKQVLLGQQYGENSFPFALQDDLLKKGWIIRRDSFGSPIWFKEKDQQIVANNFPKTAIFAENCYHHIKSNEAWWKGDGFTSIDECFASVYQDAYHCHANTLDLRVPEDACRWVSEGKEYVERFMHEGGYRFICKKVSLEKVNNRIRVHHQWMNIGRGKLPNDHLNWKGRFKLAIALFCDKKIVRQKIVKDVELANWVQDLTFKYESEIRLSKEVYKAGAKVIKVGVAIIDTYNDNEPTIRLAIDTERIEEWYIVGDIHL